MRIFPLMWARTLCPFSSSTRNMALGNGSTTVPSTRIVSSLGLARRHQPLVLELRDKRAKRTGTDRKDYLIRAIHTKPCPSGHGEYFGATLRNGDGVFEV